MCSLSYSVQATAVAAFGAGSASNHPCAEQGARVDCQGGESRGGPT